jgi:hypothetical protein
MPDIGSPNGRITVCVLGGAAIKLPPARPDALKRLEAAD